MRRLFIGGSRDGTRIVTERDDAPIQLPTRNNPIDSLDFGKPVEEVEIKTETYFPCRLVDSDGREYVVFHVESDHLSTIARLIDGYGK